MDTVQSPQPLNPHGTPLLRVLALLLFAILIAILSSLGTYYVLQKQAQKELESQPVPTPVVIYPSPTNIQTQSSQPSDPTANWKVFTSSKKNYTFKYPPVWIIEEADYENLTDILDPAKKVSIMITEGQYPYGFEDPKTTVLQTDLKVEANNKNYTVKKLIVNNKSVLVDFPLNVSNYHVIFGNFFTTSNSSLADYETNESVILKVLSTFKFLK